MAEELKLGGLQYDIEVDTSDAKKAIADFNKAADKAEENLRAVDKAADDAGKAAERSAKKFRDNLGDAFLTGSKAVAGFALALGGVAVVLGGKAISAASNLEESVNAVNVIFGDASKTVLDFGKTAAESAGLSARAFNEAVTPIGAALINVGQGAEEAAKNSIALAQRASDLASVFNTDLDSALTAIQAGLRGEADPLERFGVGLSETAVKAYAVKKGLVAAGAEMDAQTKTQARLGLLFEQTNRVAGDFVNTSDSLANQQRILKAGAENLAATFGDRLKPILATFLADVLPRLKKLWEDNGTQILAFVESAGKAVGFIATTLVTGIIKFTDFLLNNKQALLVVAGAFTAALIPALYAAATAIAPVVASMAALAAIGGGLVFFGTTLVTSLKKLTGSFYEASGASDRLNSDLKKMSNEATANVIELARESDKALLEMSINGGNFTEEMSTRVINSATAMSEAYITAISGMVTESNAKYAELLAQGVITQTEFDNITTRIGANAENLKKNNEAATAEIAKLSTTLTEVTQKLAALPEANVQMSLEIGTPEEIEAQRASLLQTQADLQAQLTLATQTQRDDIIRITTESTAQLTAIYERLKLDSSAITAEQAATVGQNAVNEANTVIGEAQKKYDDTVDFALKQAVIGNISKEQADEIIATAKEQRDGTVLAAKEQARDILVNVKSLVEQQGFIFDKHTGEAITGWQAFWRHMGRSAVELGKSMLDVVKGIFVLFGKMIWEGIKAAIAVFKFFWDTAKDMFSQAWKSLVSLLTESLPKFIQWAIDLKDGIIAKVIELKDQIFEAGKNVITGFIDGLKAKYTEAIQSVKDFAGNIIGSVKGALGIQSPSKVFREFGGFTAEGFLLGFEEQSPAAIAAMGTFVKGLNKETAKLDKKSLDFSGALEDLAAVVNDAFDAASSAVRDFANDNADAMEQIKSDIKDAEKAITELKAGFAEENADAQKSFVEDAAGVVIKAQEELITLKKELSDLLAERPDNLTDGADAVAQFQTEKTALEKSIAEKEAIISSSKNLEVSLDAEIQRQKDFNALNELEQLSAKYEQEKLSRQLAFQEQLTDLENQRLALETSLAVREQQWLDFTATLEAINSDFTAVYQDELTKREDLTRASVDRLIAEYNRLALAAQKAKSAGANIGAVGGFAEGGFTGAGSDSDVAGLVHKNEFVAPSWLVKAKPEIFSALESLRTGGMGAVNNNNHNFSYNVVNNGGNNPDIDIARMRWLGRFAF